jgi:hypothetical protein
MPVSILSHPACKSHLFCSALYCHLWHVWVYHIFPHYLINGNIFEKKSTEHKMCYDFLYNVCPKHFSLWEEFGEILLQMYIGLNVKCPLFSSDFNGTWTSRQDFKKSSNIKFHENLSSGSRVVPCGDRQTDVKTDMTKLTVAFRTFAKAPKTYRKRR